MAEAGVSTGKAQNGRVVIAMNDAQTWSIIGVLTAAVVSMVIGTFTICVRTTKTQFDAMNTSMMSGSTLLAK